MNRTLKEATVLRYHDETHRQLQEHLAAFLDGYNFARRMKTLRGLTPYEAICTAWSNAPDRLRLDPLHLTPGLNTWAAPAVLSVEYIRSPLSCGLRKRKG